MKGAEMTHKSLVMPVAIAATLLAGFGALTTGATEKPKHPYIGTEKCKLCHKTEAQGKQYVLWSESKHAKAYATLAGEEAKAVAKKLGIDDPQKSDKCLKCHVTAFGVAAEFLGPKYTLEEGVGCEACHGPGGDYNKKATMEGITRGEIAAASVGLVIPDEKLCVGCHNQESPTFKAFKYDEMAKKIAHPLPAERKALYKTEKKAAE
jgi:hypothetical protein